MPIVFKILDQQRVEEAAQVLGSSWYHDNAAIASYMASVRTISLEKMTRQFRDFFILPYLDLGLSVYAEDTESGKVVCCITGCLLTTDEDDYSNMDFELVEEFQQFHGPFLEVIEKLEHDNMPDDLKSATTKKAVLHLLVAGTITGYSGSGVASAACQFAIDNAVVKGCNYAVVETNSPVTAHIFEDKLGFTKAASISFRDWGGEVSECPGEMAIFYKKMN